MNAREADRSDDAPADKPRKTPPARMRNYRIVAEPRTEPDLHKLAQLFIGMAFARADSEHAKRGDSTRSADPGPPSAPSAPSAR